MEISIVVNLYFNSSYFAPFKLHIPLFGMCFGAGKKESRFIKMASSQPFLLSETGPFMYHFNVGPPPQKVKTYSESFIEA
jgi:hypothetical protein